MANLAEVLPEEGWFKYGADTIIYRISRNERLASRIRVHVHPNATVELECPADTNQQQIDHVVARRARWIWRNLSEVSAGRRHIRPREFVSGETHFYLGRRHQLKVIPERSSPSSVRLTRGKLEVRLPVNDPAAVRRRLDAWYRHRAEIYLSGRLHVICAEISWVTEIPTMSLLKMRKQWGNCSPGGKLTLNPALIKAPRPCIDYVLKHELCHLAEHNHSPRFYALLDRCAPNWRVEKAELDRLAELLLSGT
jgi:predicted metal-dependent hydrolase